MTRGPSTAALVVVTALTSLATDAYLASLPALQADLHTSAALVGVTLTAFIVAFAAGQLLAGPLSDSLGRRRFVVGGSLLFLVASIGCTVAPTVGVLIACRVVQGVGGGAASAAGRAMIVDKWTGLEAAKRSATLTSFVLFGPVAAPVLGGLVVAVSSWRGVFVVLTALGVAMTLVAAVALPETLPAAQHTAAPPRAQLQRYTSLLQDRRFRGVMSVQVLNSAAMWVYIGASSFVLQDRLGVSSTRYALVFAVNALVMTAVSAAFSLLLARTPNAAAQLGGITLSLAGATALVGAAISGRPGLAEVWVLLAVVTAGVGLTTTATAVAIQEAGRRSPGTATALTTALSFAVGAITAPLASAWGPPTLISMAGLMAVLLLLDLSAALANRSGVGKAAGRPAASQRQLSKLHQSPNDRDR